MNPNSESPLNRLAIELERSRNLAASLQTEIYVECRDGVSSVGAHVRHILDVVNNLLSGLEKGWVDYTDRERDLLTETDRSHAVRRLAKTMQRLTSSASQKVEGGILVRSESNPDEWYDSSVAREIEFVFSHTVHHHALIAERLRQMGVKPTTDLGVSPSTSEYQTKLKLAA